MGQSWHYRMLGEEFGPVGSDALDALIADGTLSDEDEVRPASRMRWQTVAAYRRGEELPADPFVEVPQGKSISGGNLLAQSSPSTQSSPSISAVLEQPTLGNDTWYFDVFGHDFGPVSFEELLEAAERGQIGPDDQVRLGLHGKPRRAGSIGRLMTCMPFVSPASGGSVHSIDATALLKAAADTATPTPAAGPAPGPQQPVKVTTAAAKSAVANPAALEDLWFAWINGKQYGPVPMARLGQWLSSGQLQPSHHIRPAVATDWVLLESMPELLAALAPELTAPITIVAPPPQTASTPTIPTLTPIAPAARVSAPIPRTDPDPHSKSDNEPSLAPTAAVSAPSPAAWSPPSRPSPVRLPPSRGRSSSGGGFSLSSLSLGGLVGAFKFDIRLIAVAVVALLIVGWMFLPESTAGDRKHLATLQGLLQEARDIRAKKEGITAWEAFSEKAKRLGAPILKEYEQTASAKKPAKQYLLRVVKYCLPDLLTTGMVEPAKREEELERNLNLAAKRLGVTP